MSITYKNNVLKTEDFFKFIQHYIVLQLIKILDLQFEFMKWNMNIVFCFRNKRVLSNSRQSSLFGGVVPLYLLRFQ